MTKYQMMYAHSIVNCGLIHESNIVAFEDGIITGAEAEHDVNSEFGLNASMID